MLEARNLSVSLGTGRLRRQVLCGLNVEVSAGRWTCVLGPNGSGKSTLLKTLAGVWHAGAVGAGAQVQGDVLLRGAPLSRLPARQRAQTVAWLAQGEPEATANDLSAYDVAMLGRLPHRGWLAAPGPQDHAAVEQALRRTHAWDWRHRPLGALSGGERQRVLLARLLAVQASVLLMDEPIANLDPPHQADWLRLVRDLVKQGHTVVSVLHDVSLALLADDLVLLRQGVVHHAGPSHSEAARAAIESVFDHRLRLVRTEEGGWVAAPC